MTALRLSGVIFDLDGTLVDSLHDIATAINLTRADVGLAPLPESDITRLVGDGSAALVRATVPVLEARLAETVEQYVAHYGRHVLDTTRLFPGIEVLLKCLAPRPLAVVTNKNLHLAEAVLTGLGIRDLFSVVLGGDSLPERKPHPLPILVTLERFGLPARQVAMVGDGVHDVQAGRAARAVTIGVTYGVAGRARLEAEKPDYLIDTVEELGDLIT
jgi:phosphoglycolate phosphatase